MAHKLSIYSIDRYGTTCQYILPKQPGDDVLAAFQRQYRRPLYSNKRRSVDLDNRRIVDKQQSLKPWERFSLGIIDYGFLAAGAGLALTLALMFSVWLVATVLLGAGAVYAKHRATLPARREADKRMVESYLKQPGAIDLQRPSPVLMWALRLHAVWSYPACEYRMTRESFGTWLESHRELYKLDDAIVFVREHGYLDVARFADTLPELYEMQTQDYERERFQRRHYLSFETWVNKYGEHASYLIGQIQHDPDITGAYAAMKDIDANKHKPGYAHEERDAALLTKLESEVGARVDAIVSGVDEGQRMEAVAAHEGVETMVAMLFKE